MEEGSEHLKTRLFCLGNLSSSPSLGRLAKPPHALSPVRHSQLL